MTTSPWLLLLGLLTRPPQGPVSVCRGLGQALDPLFLSGPPSHLILELILAPNLQVPLSIPVILLPFFSLPSLPFSATLQWYLGFSSLTRIEPAALQLEAESDHGPPHEVPPVDLTDKFNSLCIKRSPDLPHLQLAVPTVFPISDNGNIILLLAGPKTLESFFFFFALHFTTYGILVSQPGLNLGPARKVPSPNHRALGISSKH